MRTPDGNPLRWEVSADIEALTWDPHNPTCFLASSEDGIVAAFDARAGAGGAPLYRLSAHDKPTCCLSFCPAARGLLATGSTDSQVWAAHGLLWYLLQLTGIAGTAVFDKKGRLSDGLCGASHREQLQSRSKVVMSFAVADMLTCIIKSVKALLLGAGQAMGCIGQAFPARSPGSQGWAGVCCQLQSRAAITPGSWWSQGHSCCVGHSDKCGNCIQIWQKPCPG